MVLDGAVWEPSKSERVSEPSHQGGGAMTVHGKVEHFIPEGVAQNPAFTNVVAVSGPAKTVYIGGQNAVTETGAIVAAGEIGGQTERVFRNLETALGATGAALDNVIKWNILVVKGQPLYPAFEVFQRVWGRRPNSPLIMLAKVAGLAEPDYLVELEAIAVVPE
jgi:enamine deaminase RidA (YjgF/YER057c/UK114 family)